MKANANNYQKKVKKDWSLLITLHFILFPDYVKSYTAKKPLVDIVKRFTIDLDYSVSHDVCLLKKCIGKLIGSKNLQQINHKK